MVRIGVIGAGGMGNVHTRHFVTMDDVEIRFLERDPGKRAEFAARHGVTPVDSMSELLDWAEAVDICLPTDLHRPVALEALAAGKHVLCEKPMALNLAECEEMISAAARAGKHLVPAQVVRFFPEYERLRDRVPELGQVLGVRMRRGGRAPVGSEAWFHNPARSGGVVLDLAIHDLDWLRWTFGEVAHVLSRSARGAGTLPPGCAGDYALTTLSFASGLFATCESTWLDPSGFRVAVQITGTEGVLEYDSRFVPQIMLHTQFESVVEVPREPRIDPFYRQGRAFIAAVRGEAPPAVTAQDGLAAVCLARAAIESAETGKIVVPHRG